MSGEDPVHYSRPSIDVLMESAADVYGPRLAGILLTGANTDGADGLAKIGERGGLTVVQDPPKPKSPPCPKRPSASAQPHLILPLDGIRSLLLQLDKSSC